MLMFWKLVNGVSTVVRQGSVTMMLNVTVFVKV